MNPDIDSTHDPRAATWVEGADDHTEFPVQNLPLGVFSLKPGQPRIGTAIGDFVLDLTALGQRGILPPPQAEAVRHGTLNTLFALPPADRRGLRLALFALLTSADERMRISAHLYPAAACTLLLPFQIGDYTDFYVGIHHAKNIGKLFRPDNPLLPNYKYVPIGYHGRASSVRPSGTPVIRPDGQRKLSEEDEPSFGPCRRLDYELELGVWIAGENPLGTPVPIARAWDRIGGICLLNDWSARDIQNWEYQPLGPFLAKNFLSSVSPWVVTAEALAPFRISQPERPADDPRPLPYLHHPQDQLAGALAITLEAHIASRAMREAGAAPMRLSRGPASNMYWTVAQMIAHHSSNGCNLLPGDLLGTGTISGPDAGSFGSLIEISGGGQSAIELPTGETRFFLEDGDELILHARAERDGFRTIGFGFCAGTVLARN